MLWTILEVTDFIHLIFICVFMLFVFQRVLYHYSTRFFGVVYNKMDPSERLYPTSHCQWDTTFPQGVFCCTPLQKPVLWFYPVAFTFILKNKVLDLNLPSNSNSQYLFFICFYNRKSTPWKLYTTPCIFNYSMHT